MFCEESIQDCQLLLLQPSYLPVAGHLEVVYADVAAQATCVFADELVNRSVH